MTNTCHAYRLEKASLQQVQINCSYGDTTLHRDQRKTTNRKRANSTNSRAAQKLLA